MRPFTLLISLSLILFAVSCGLNDTNVDLTVIESFTADPATVAPGETTTLLVRLGEDGRKRPLYNYRFTLLDEGTVQIPGEGRDSGKGASIGTASPLKMMEVSWIAPEMDGMFRIEVRVIERYAPDETPRDTVVVSVSTN